VTDLAAPTTLGTAGKRLWKSITADIEPGWRLDARELHLLERGCRVEDEVRELEAAVDRDGVLSEGSKVRRPSTPPSPRPASFASSSSASSAGSSSAIRATARPRRTAPVHGSPRMRGGPNG
jgi:hypothetical protein